MAMRAISGRRAVGLPAAMLALALAGCAAARQDAGSSEPRPVIRVSSPHGHSQLARVSPARCPAGLRGCRRVEGRIVYVERHDPDGDGDAHFVILDSQGITLPGLTAIKVGKGLRPHPLPGIGDLVSVAGRVQDGSVGESEIHALEVHVATRSGR